MEHKLKRVELLRNYWKFSTNSIMDETGVYPQLAGNLQKQLEACNKSTSLTQGEQDFAIV